MAHIITISLQKGGCGKTTTTECLGTVYGLNGKKVLLIDMDGQANLTDSLLPERPRYTMSDLLAEECRIDQAIVSLDNYDLIAGDEYLYNVDRLDITYNELENIIKNFKDNYDIILIDSPPSLGNLQKCCIKASDAVLIPAMANVFCLNAILALHETIKEINPQTVVKGIVMTQFEQRMNASRQIREMIEEEAEELGMQLFETNIRKSTVVVEAQAMFKSPIIYAPKNNVVSDYKAVAKELMERLEG